MDRNNRRLRPYQERDIERLRASFAAGRRRVLYQAPTSSGKTVLFAAVVAGAAARGNRVVILGHRDEIVQQIYAALDELGVDHGIIAAGYPELPMFPVQVASVQTLARRLPSLRGRHRLAPDLLVIDESHHAVASTWLRILDALPEAHVLGTTATPQRLDGRGLSDIFDELVIGPSTAELIEQGYLSRFTTYAPSRAPDLSRVHTRMGDYAIDELVARMSGVVITDAVDEYARRCPGAPAIAFCVDIRHSEMVAAAFAAHGFHAAHVDGTTQRDERRRLIAALGSGELQVLCNCGLISEGLDVPSVVAAILLRPTKSLALYLQMIGRALRPAPAKDRALILDHAGNTFRFGLADAPRKWSLEGKAKDEDARAAAPVKRCGECGAVIPIASIVCPECGAQQRVIGPAHGERHVGPLIETGRLAAMSYGQALRWAGPDKHRLHLVAQARGYKPGWVWHRLQELAES